MTDSPPSGSQSSRSNSQSSTTGHSSKKSSHSRIPSLPIHLPGFHSSHDKEKHSHADTMLDIKSPTRRRFLSTRLSRSKSPAPIITNATDTTTTLVVSPTENTFTHSGHVMDSPLPMSPITSPSEQSHSSSKKRHSYSSRKSSNDYKRLSGTVNHCGRHANDWLFGGFSVRESVRGLLKDDHEDNNSHERHR
ncbi:hypothetical protein DIZ76_015769 [Coccidioides immitis]|uniref:Uncharacterized protein n=1 Tax=Coccidioides immitis RMSCC 2394 TaxID=404692 RepID=A0A0J6Y9Y3_COCIT|nr:hypothetical protein CIRG_05167 [Coccidioides immitis RMSCC 2394]TPX21806.1 hypothetical protein DIZ76_015769 [Coccidioides immitis]